MLNTKVTESRKCGKIPQVVEAFHKLCSRLLYYSNPEQALPYVYCS